MRHHPRNVVVLASALLLAAAPLLAAPRQDAATRAPQQSSRHAAAAPSAPVGAASTLAPATPATIEHGNPLVEFFRQLVLDAGISIDGNG